MSLPNFLTEHGLSTYTDAAKAYIAALTEFNELDDFLVQPGNETINYNNYTATKVTADATINIAMTTVERSFDHYTHTIVENIIMNEGDYDYRRTFTILEDAGVFQTSCAPIERIAKE